jgi:hypothetical protein
VAEEFKAIDPVTYADWSKAQWAQNTAKVKAEFVPAGTVVETIMADGHVETTKTAGADGGYKVTNPTGEQYLVDPAKFEKRYQPSAPGIYEPKFDPVQVVRIEESVAFKAPWGEDMRIKAGGALVNGGGNDVYGIQPEEFEATYSMITAPGATRPAAMPKLEM